MAFLRIFRSQTYTIQTNTLYSFALRTSVYKSFKRYKQQGHQRQRLENAVRFASVASIASVSLDQIIYFMHLFMFGFFGTNFALLCFALCDCDTKKYDMYLRHTELYALCAPWAQWFAGAHKAIVVSFMQSSRPVSFASSATTTLPTGTSIPVAAII